MNKYDCVTDRNETVSLTIYSYYICISLLARFNSLYTRILVPMLLAQCSIIIIKRSKYNVSTHGDRICRFRLFICPCSSDSYLFPTSHTGLAPTKTDGSVSSEKGERNAL